MADLSNVIMRVTGRKTACLAFLISTNWADCESDLREYFDHKQSDYPVDDTPFSILFSGCAKWSLDAYCRKEWTDGAIALERGDRAYLEQIGEQYSGYDLRSRTRIFDVDVRVNEGYDNGSSDYRHFISGKQIEDECPYELEVYMDTELEEEEEARWDAIGDEVYSGRSLEEIAADYEHTVEEIKEHFGLN